MSRRAIAPALLLIAAGLSCDVERSGSPATVARPGQLRPGVTEVTAPLPEQLLNRRAIYVPVYSHVYTADTAQPLNLAATLFIRNTDAAESIIVTRVRYFDSGGKPIRDFLTKPLQIGPLASMDFFIKESDVSGGASPSFVVEWWNDLANATKLVDTPLAESVMIGTAGTQGISFICPGRPIAPPKP